jgi:hypothetical protein
LPDARVEAILDWIEEEMLDADYAWRDRRLILFTEWEDTRRWLVERVKEGLLPQFPNKTRSTLTRDRFCGPEHPGTSHLRVVYHLVGFCGTHGESGHDRVQSARVGLA